MRKLELAAADKKDATAKEIADTAAKSQKLASKVMDDGNQAAKTAADAANKAATDSATASSDAARVKAEAKAESER